MVCVVGGRGWCGKSSFQKADFESHRAGDLKKVIPFLKRRKKSKVDREGEGDKGNKEKVEEGIRGKRNQGNEEREKSRYHTEEERISSLA